MESWNITIRCPFEGCKKCHYFEVDDTYRLLNEDGTRKELRCEHEYICANAVRIAKEQD